MMKAKLKCMELDDLACIEKGCDRECDNCDLNYAQGNRGEQKEAMEIAISVLEKQIPKKRIKGKMYKTLGYYQCPICGGMLTTNKGFCKNCGQAIDWR